MSKRNDYDSYIPSLRKRVYDLWVQNQHVKPSEACEKLNLDPKKQRPTVRNYLYYFRRNYILGTSQGSHRKWFKFCVDGSRVDRGLALSFGWRVSGNRNRCLVFGCADGSIEWFENGTVLLWVNHGLPVGRAKGLFSEAFSNLASDKYLVELLDSPENWGVQEQDYVFEVAQSGQRLPPFRIEKFKESHGLTIYTDRSHPTAIEVRETAPFWVERQAIILASAVASAVASGFNKLPLVDTSDINEQSSQKPQPLRGSVKSLYDR